MGRLLCWFLLVEALPWTRRSPESMEPWTGSPVELQRLRLSYPVAELLRRRRSNAQLNFADRLYERATADSVPEEGGEARGAQNPSRPSEQYQTFSEPVRNVIDHRSRLLQKEVVVLSPGPTQKWLTFGLIDDLFRLKGLHFPILADVSGGANFLDELRTRLPPHRLFDLTRM